MPVNADATGETDDPQQDGLPINELFYSLQGEGQLAGVPSVFVRTSGCNLRCWFCDSYHTSWEPTHAWMEVDDILADVAEYQQAAHVVLTGGEPMMHEESITLLDRLSAEGYHTTVETNGTIYRDGPIDLASISPKLASSTPTPERDPTGEGNWEQRHDERRIDMDALARLVEAYDFQLKFVVTDRDDLAEIDALVDRIDDAASTTIGASDVLLMPEGATRNRLEKTRETVAQLAMERGYQFTPRLHVTLWNDAPGT